MKITGGKLKGRTIGVPKTSLRPTQEMVRQAIFNSLAFTLKEGFSCLDLFAGSGAFGIEALSRGAKSATFIELSKKATLQIKQNLSSLDLVSDARVIQGDVIDCLSKLEGRYDLIFADPPYGNEKQTQQLLSQIPPLLEIDGIFILEQSFPIEKTDFGGMECIKTRRYGSTYLSEFRITQNS